jgi:tRNA A-37 threonylcarbamoyl transferase component Bud32
MNSKVLLDIGTQKRYPLSDGTYTFGRDKDCDFVFTQRSISTNHCQLIIDNDKCFVKDTSLNGTFIDERKIGKENTAELAIRAALRIAPNVLFQVLPHPELALMEDDIEKLEEGEEHAAFDKNSALGASYFCGKHLGSGAFAEVRLCTHRETRKLFAAKIVDKERFSENCPSARDASYLDEIKILKRLRHRNIVSVEDVFESEKYLTMILQYVEGGDLFDKIIELSRYTESDAKIVFKQMLDGLTYLHENNIAHRDLKPENYLVLSRESDVHIVMADFGLAKVYQTDDNIMETMCGTPQYLAPELVIQMRSGKITGYTNAVDMWALGVILFVLLSGHTPFNPKDFDKIINARFSFSHGLWKTISAEAKDLITRLLARNPDERLTVQQASSHPWLLNVVVPPVPFTN